MSIQWQDNGYTFYGKESLPHTARMQDPGSMECWAFCLGAVAGLPWSTVATHTALGDLTHGQNTANTNLLVERLNQLPGGPTLRLPARWYSPDWDGNKLRQMFPAAVAIDHHFVVALAIGKALGQPDAVRYWDPADAQIHTVTVDQFRQNFNPEFSVTRI
ncbi:hypothetical protein OHU34_41770 [Streptomyces sp. NBC_00080]|uniref:hypothetical protein n=1 Tax=Streptomyces TaxID=1883 RepID=UPI00114D8DCE|nr:MULTISPECIES: hypothetical protein [Streptomyces]TQJ46395.1 hypothetical protein FBY34_5778 [Streptomyces sp. SLBN-115]